MNIAILDICWREINPENPFCGALGGSETWLLQIANEFSKKHKVDLYINSTLDYPYYDNNINYFPFDKFLSKERSYDFIILNRFFEKDKLYNFDMVVNYIDFIKINKLANHIYIQIHDLSLTNANGDILDDSTIDYEALNDDFVTIVTLNEWHRSNLIKQYPKLKLPLCIPNGLDLELFDNNENNIRDNRILWSSCTERGLNILKEDIYPIVKKEIPDFGIDIATYNEYCDDNDSKKDIKYLGKLSKKDLYKEMAKHKVWFYPGTFAETFCITLIENIMSGCQVVSPFTYGMSATIDSSEIKMSHIFNAHDKDEYMNAVNEAANKIISILKTDNTLNVYGEIKQKIKEKYNWDYSANLYIYNYIANSYNSENLLMKKPKIMFLTMGCNTPFFRGLMAAVKDTWAKAIIKGEIKNCEWYGYTSCDMHHTEEYVDEKERMIYVKNDDILFTTYSKTRDAYNLLKSTGIEFDYVVRTNCSTFINVKKLVEIITLINKDKILGGLCGYYNVFANGERKFMYNIIVGLFEGMKREFFDIAMSGDEKDHPIPIGDDVIASDMLSKKLFPLVEGETVISPNGDLEYIYPRYKAFLAEDKQLLLNRGIFINEEQQTNDPNIINKFPVVQLRTLYSDLPERAEKGHEIEHFYELYDAME